MRKNRTETTYEFTNYNAAATAVAEAELKINSVKKAIPIAIAATVVMTIGALITNQGSTAAQTVGSIICLIGFGIGIASYVLGSIKLRAFGFIVTMAKAGWYLTPFWGTDILVAIIAAVIGFALCMYFPAAPLISERNKSQKELEAARTYLAYTQVS